MTTGTIVRTRIITSALLPVMRIPSSMLVAIIPSVTRAIDRPMARAIRSMMVSCLKKTNVQAKPGKKKTSITPSIALTADRLSISGITKSSICSISGAYAFPPRVSRD